MVTRSLDEAERRRQYRTLMAGYVAELGPAEVGYLDRLFAAPVNWKPVFEMSKEFLAAQRHRRPLDTV